MNRLVDYFKQVITFILVFIISFLITINSHVIFAAPEDWSDPINLSNTPNYTYEHAIAVDHHGNTHVVWWDWDTSARVNNIFYTKWDGSMWSNPIVLSQGKVGMQALAVDSLDNLHLVYSAGRPRNYLVYQRVFNGTSWSAPIPISVAINDGVVSAGIAIDAMDNLHVTFIDIRRWPVSHYQNTLYYTEWNGASWSTPQHIGDISVWPRLAVDNSGIVHVAWVERGQYGGSSSVYYRKKDGSSWSLRTKISSTLQASRLSLTTNSEGDIYAAWQTAGDIFYAYNSGSNWFGPSNITNTSNYSDEPNLTFDSNDNLHLVWKKGNGNFDIYHQMWNGTVWSPSPTNISHSSRGAAGPIIAVDSGGNLHVIWSDYRPGNWDVFYSTKPPESPPTFLDLPWDYEALEMDFKDAALSMYSFFDHKYPLMWSEPTETRDETLIYTGKEDDDDIIPYSGHNGYDFGRKSKVTEDGGVPVLAPAAGMTTYKYDTNGGNTIILNHENGFFTWFMHLQEDGLVASKSADLVSVAKGDQLGLVGNTGKPTGPHLHFSVIKDLNENGVLDFGTDYPYGLVDPYGWDPDDPGFIDPWPVYGGSESSYLWTTPLIPTIEQVSQVGAILYIGRAEFRFPYDPDRPDLTITLKERPTVHGSFRLRGISHAFDISAKDANGDLVTTFSIPYTLSIGYGDHGDDLTNTYENSLRIYWLNPDTNIWELVPTDLDTVYDIAYAQINHTSQFILMGEAKDLTAPTTTIELVGEKGQDNWFHSDVTVNLEATDDEDGIGIEYTYYSIDNDIDWELYSVPIPFEEEGTHTIYVHSIDKGDNIEIPHSLTFHIDKTKPEIVINTPTHEAEYLLNQEIIADWSATDSYSGLYSAIGTVASGETIDTSSAGEKTFEVTAEDLAGNQTTETVTYYVNYQYGGLLFPLNNKNKFIMGSAIPVKFQLTDIFGNYISTAEARLFLIYGDEQKQPAISKGNSNTENLFRYDFQDSQYIFNLDTKVLSKGIWFLRIELNDSTSQQTEITLI